MKNKEKKYAIYNNDYSHYIELKEENISTPEKFKEYFGYIADDDYDKNGEIVIYELVPVKTFKKEINYKFV